MRLLVIDDEEDISDIVAEIARARGFEVDTLNDPSMVADKIAEFPPDIIILDLMMPGTDGVELLRVMVDKVKHAKICLMSGSDSRVLNSAKRLGGAHGLDIVAALEKPIDIAKLRALLDQMSGGIAVVDDGVGLAKAISQGQLLLHYQPVVEIATKRVKGVEALIRWEHPTRGLLNPADFIGAIAAEGLMQSMTAYVMNTAITQAAAWHHAGDDLTVSINVTASSLLDLSMPDKLVEMCRTRDLPPDRLVLEVTENEAMRDVTRTMDVLLRLRIRDIGVSIDDFGTGHSSLRELQRMPFSEMKIDQSFVMNMVENKDSAVIVNAIVDLGHNLGLKVVAEGIDDTRIWQLLAEKGCDCGQGYYIAKPKPAAEFNRWLAAWRETTGAGTTA